MTLCDTGRKPAFCVPSKSDSDALDYCCTHTSRRWAEGLSHAAQVFVINAPSGMSMVWKVACYFMPAATKRKVTVLGTSYKSELEAAIGRENMPSCYGGAKEFEWPKHRPVKELKY